MQKDANCKELLSRIWSFLTHASLILPRGAQTPLELVLM
jgi:hypothetical protein